MSIDIEDGLLTHSSYFSHSSHSSPYVWILANISTLDAVGGVKPFPDYPFAERLVEALSNNRLLIVAKSRQMMATWVVSAYYLYRAIYGDPGVYLFLSKGARDSKELLRRLKTMIRNLPGDLPESIKIKAEEISFPNESRIISLPATEFGPRSHSPSGVFWDEMAFTPNSEEIWTSIKPAIDSGGSFVGVSTPNGSDNTFQLLYFDDSNHFGKFRLHWRDHPLRNEAWAEGARRGLSKDKWMQEYEIDFNILATAVYKEFDPKLHLLAEPFDPRIHEGNIYRGLDFGYHHPFAVWLHLSPEGMLTVFDEWEGGESTIEEVGKALMEIDGRYGISEQDVKFTGCDPAGKQVDDNGISAIERLTEKGFKLVHCVSRISEGVDLVKTLLRDANGFVRLRFSPRAERMIYHFKHYRWDAKKKNPCKTDGHDHACDALRYLIVNLSVKQCEPVYGAKVMGTRG